MKMTHKEATMLLAIDTSTQMISLALHDGAQVCVEETWQTHNNHTTELAPAVQRMLRRADWSAQALTAVAVSIGPGTYSGLRVGVSLAKGIAAAHDLPLIGVTSLDILALAQPQFDGDLIVVAGAGRKRIVAGRYKWRHVRWQASEEPINVEWSALLAGLRAPVIISGEVDAEGMHAVQEARSAGAPVTLAPPAQRVRRAGFLAEEAWQRLRNAPPGTSFAAAQVVPIYLKTKDSPQ
ncbi:tRNA (adenosine(37)-N6)-threonylcarbamoyltransferase complex dimerization subunit type 1 TsaB [Anaerolineae bacterium CFX9]|jgi:tRNA threonylcarbamoyladenosine biosynthesis protein TsaB|nr:tRNA (adenosine(37)-N6)-threonylcarbamoyltransferase complex dimerization subunit type 1 TsaB [Anaerolineae bacterium CFX9]